MALPNATYFDNIRHTLYSTHKAPLIITDPIGYENSNEEFTRTIQNIGVIANFSSDLKFVNDGLDYIQDIVLNHGINETILIKKEARDNSTDEWIELYTGTLDLMTYDVEDGTLSMKINSGGIDKVFKSRESEKVEIESTTSLDEVAIEDLVPKAIFTNGRELFLKTVFDVQPSDNSAYMLSKTKDSNKRGTTVCVPLNVSSKSHDNAHNTSTDIQIEDNSDERNARGTSEMMFFANSDKKRSLQISITISFTPRIMNYHQITWSRYYLRLATYRDGASFNFKKAVNLWYADNKITSYDKKNQNVTYSGVLDLEVGESLSLQFSQLMQANGRAGYSYLEIISENISADVTISESGQLSPPTLSKMILMHDLGERLSLLITGKKNVFKSNILGRKELGYRSDGAWAYIATYCGHWLRGFDRFPLPKPASNGTPEVVNKYKAYSTSFKDFSETLRAVFNIHVGFQSINGNDLVVAENFNYFFNQSIGLVLPIPLSKPKRYVAEDFIFSSVEIGYEKGDQIEGVQGLDEPNGKANWVSNITALKNPYVAISKYIAGVYAEEKQRQYQKSAYPTLDREFDTDIFMKDCKLEYGNIKERTWSDDFSAPPTGIFSPDTTKNLRLSPANNLRRHGVLLSAPLKHYQDKYLSFGSSTSNSGMVTRPKMSENEIAENGSVLNSKLGNRIFEPFYIEGEHAVSTEIAKFLRGSTKLNGVDTPNFYFKIQFTLENDSMIRYGWIMSVKPDGAGKWKIIEAAN